MVICYTPTTPFLTFSSRHVVQMKSLDVVSSYSVQSLCNRSTEGEERSQPWLIVSSLQFLNPIKKAKVLALHIFFQICPFQTCVLVRAICVKNESHTVFLLSQGCSSNKAVGDRGIRPLMVACFINIKERNRNFQDIVQVQSQSRTRRQLWPKYLDVYLHLEP